MTFLGLMAQENINHHQLGQLYNYVVDNKLPEKAGYEDARAWVEPVPDEFLPTLRVVLEAEATNSESLGGPFTLKLWNAQGPGGFTLTGVTFP